MALLIRYQLVNWLLWFSNIITKAERLLHWGLWLYLAVKQKSDLLLTTIYVLVKAEAHVLASWKFCFVNCMPDFVYFYNQISLNHIIKYVQVLISQIVKDGSIFFIFMSIYGKMYFWYFCSYRNLPPYRHLSTESVWRCGSLHLHFLVFTVCSSITHRSRLWFSDGAPFQQLLWKFAQASQACKGAHVLKHQQFALNEHLSNASRVRPWEYQST